MPKREKGKRIRGSMARSGHRSHVKGARRFLGGTRKSEIQDKLAADAARIASGLIQRDGEAPRAFVRRVARTNPIGETRRSAKP